MIKDNKIIETYQVVASEYRKHGLRLALDRHSELKKNMPSYRWTSALIDHIIPFFSIAELMLKLDIGINNIGFQKACEELAHRIGFNWCINMTANTERVLTDEKVLIYSNHTNFLDLLFIGASLPPRRDIQILAAELLTKIGPGFSSIVLPVPWSTIEYNQLISKQYNVMERLRLRLLAELSLPLKRSAYRQAINDTLTKSAYWILSGGEVLIFPSGGHQNWRNGIVRVLDLLLTSSQGGPVAESTYLIPLYVINVKRSLMLASSLYYWAPVMPWLYKKINQKPVNIVVDEPILFGELINKFGADARSIVNHIKRQFMFNYSRLCS
jgi:hypothetical protein